MKKFAFILATVAVLAMSAAAWAVDQATKVEIAKYTGSDRHNNSDAASSPKIYFPKGTTPKLNIGLNLLLDKDGVAEDLKYDAVINGIRIPGGFITKDKGNQEPRPVVFRISGEHGINYADDFKMSFGVYNDSGENITTIKSADATFKPTPVEIGLSSGGEAVNALTVDLDDDVDEDFTLAYDKTMFAGMEADLGKLKVGALAPGSSFGISTEVSITSADVTGPDALVEGLTIGFDSTKGQLTVKGVPVEVRKVTLALYFEKADVKTALAITDGSSITGAILATPTSADSTEWHNPEAFIIAAFDLKVVDEPTPPDPTPDPKSDDVDDVVESVSADRANPLLRETISKADVPAAIEIVRDSGLAVGADGRLAPQTVVDAIEAAGTFVWGTNGSADVKPLPIVSSDIKDSGKIATIVFPGLKGADLVSDDAGGRVVSVSDLNIMKIVASDDVTRLSRAGDVSGKTEAQLNGTFNVCLRGGEIVDSVNSRSDDYELRVYILDDARYDFNDTVAGNVVDPIAIVKSTGSGGKSSSGACDTGFGLVAAAGLAAAALRRRGK